MAEPAVMTMDDHVLGIGTILGNLQALEFVLRVFLGEAHGEELKMPDLTTKTLPRTFITNYISLGPIIEKYNAALSESEKGYSVGDEAVKIRDAIAHGRISSLSPTAPMTLYKFGRPDNGMVPIEYAEVLSMDWFNKKRELLRTQIKNVLDCAKNRDYNFVKPAT